MRVSSSLLPPATGRPSEILVVTDTALWQSQAGQTLKDILREPIAGILTDEPMFKVNMVTPVQMNKVLRRLHSLVYLINMDAKTPIGQQMTGYFSEASKQRIANDALYTVKQDSNVYARGQSVLYLFAQNEELLQENLVSHKDLIQELLLGQTYHRIQLLYKDGYNQELRNAVYQNTGLLMSLPKSFEVAREQKNFVWLRKLIDVQTDQNIIISRRPYRSELQFETEYLMNWRDSLARQYLTGSGKEFDTTAYIMVERLVPLGEQVIASRQPYTKNIRAAWKLSNNTRGGTLTTYAFTDPESEYLYYVEGFVYAPGSSKRPLLRELEALIRTAEAGR